MHINKIMDLSGGFVPTRIHSYKRCPKGKGSAKYNWSPQQKRMIKQVPIRCSRKRSLAKKRALRASLCNWASRSTASKQGSSSRSPSKSRSASKSASKSRSASKSASKSRSVPLAQGRGRRQTAGINKRYADIYVARG